jgi:hypothetical protein
MQCIAYHICEMSHNQLTFKEQLLIKDVSYLTYTTLISNNMNHMFLMSSLSNVNQ